MLSFLAEIIGQPGNVDLQPLSWLVTLFYFSASLLCLWAGRRERAIMRRSQIASTPIFWYAIAALMLLMGCGVQLGMPTWITELGREAAQSGGWYERRRPIQKRFVVACGVLGMALAIGGLYGLRSQWKRCGLAYIGAVYLLIFVVVRAASLHQIDTLLYRLPGFGSNMNAVLELGGTVLVGLGALIGPCRAPEPEPASIPDDSFRGHAAIQEQFQVGGSRRP